MEHTTLQLAATTTTTTTTTSAPSQPPPEPPPNATVSSHRVREEGELFSSDDDDENRDTAAVLPIPDSSVVQSIHESSVVQSTHESSVVQSIHESSVVQSIPDAQTIRTAQTTSTVQSTIAAQTIPAIKTASVRESGAAPLVQKSIQGVQGGSKNVPLQTNKQSTSQKSLVKNQLPPKSPPWTGPVGNDKNLVISFSDDDSGSDLDTKDNATKLDSHVKHPSSSLVKSNKLQLQQNGRGVQKAMPKRFSSNHTFTLPMTKNRGSISKGVGSMSLGQGSRTKYFKPVNKNVMIREHGRDQGVVSNDSKLQDLRHQIALRESELRLKAALQTKEAASILGRDHNVSNLKNDIARKYTPPSSEALEPREPDRKRLKLGTSAVGSQQEVPVSKSILPSKDSARQNCYHQERNHVGHSQNEIPLCRGKPTIVTSEKQPDKHTDNSLHNMPFRPREGDVSYGVNQIEKSIRPIDPCIAPNQSAVPENMNSNSMPKNLVAPSGASLLSHKDNAHVSEHNNMDLDSIFGMEELIDKELEEAQEHRHKCEIEERNALKIYLKAQRALLEANARCTNLYRKRELCSANLRSLILNNPSFSWSSGQHQDLDSGPDYLTRHGYEIPTSSCQRPAEYNDNNNPSFDSNIQGMNLVTGANLGPEPFGEPDASTSEPLPQMGNNAENGIYSPSDELDTSGNENGEISPAGNVSSNLDAEYNKEQDSNGKLMDIDTTSNANFSTDCPQDSLLLEATLRSQLFARLGTKGMKTSIPSNNTVAAAEHGPENEVGSQRNQEHHGVVVQSGVDDNDLQGIARQERSIHLDSTEIQSEQNSGGNSLESNGSGGSGGQGHMPCQGHHSTNDMTFPSLIFRSAFRELREISPFYPNQFQNKNDFIHTNDSENRRITCLSYDEMKWSNLLEVSVPVTVGNLLSEESSYSCSSAVDPFWPLCMYELRGKCNNDECPWQHVKDYDDGNLHQEQHINSNNPGRLPLHQQNCNGVTKVPNGHKATVLPTYLVGLDVLKADQFAYKAVMAHRSSQYWQKHFSFTLATSSMLRNGIPADAPLLHGGDERIEVHDPWNNYLSSFQWRTGARNQIKQAMADSEQAVEMAALILNQETNKLHGVRKALSILSKALETDPKSFVLWIVYLLIYYGNFNPDEKNDMFFYAVKHCEGCYVLWLMYINSQRKLDDRLAAYDAALSELCQQASAAVEDRAHESACILDLFLQMLDCLCMSGNIEKAIHRSYGIIPTTTKSDEPNHLSLSDILNCLTISDKCVFWVCCVYLVIYRKLPDAVVLKFECEKDLLDIEWPSIRLSEDDKEMAIKLVETAVESVDSHLCSESVKSDANLRAAQLFALNHIRCMVALDNLFSSRDLFDKYMKLYPSCIELVLLLARIQKQESNVANFTGFEEAISIWPNEVPGISCIWNQYVENALQNQRIDFAKEIISRWFHSVWKVQELSNGGVDASSHGNSCGSSGLNSKPASDTLTSDHKSMDMMFGFLNLSLYYFFQNNVTEACLAVDKAKNIVAFGGLEHSMRKHVMFLLCDALSLKEDGPNDAIKKILEVYMDPSTQALLVPKVLTRKSFDSIKKPRVQHLINNILTPVSFDCTLLNFIVQSWFGSSHLPRMVSDPKYLVDFVEAIMEVVPSNFQLAIIVCKLLSNSHNNSDVSSASLWFWACSNLVNAILSSVPIPPEYVWVKAGGFLQNPVGIEAVSQRFFGRALSVYPYSIELWKCFYKLNKTIGVANDIVEAAKERGISIKLD
ncbi:uncharacterized protein LOC107486953 isoform X1 [Arachis duranensis]|uniref:Uncharacterized protein LOC107486953 isoform X1 n=1 Tax=Arachis duranensis TaxID=130453 RepID=A0A6P4D9Q0_ARADU|nr:uncharacterized protein LOC107486953 isoform X1 [Arachis duranensis]